MDGISYDFCVGWTRNFSLVGKLDLEFVFIFIFDTWELNFHPLFDVRYGLDCVAKNCQI